MRVVRRPSALILLALVPIAGCGDGDAKRPSAAGSPPPTTVSPSTPPPTGRSTETTTTPPPMTTDSAVSRDTQAKLTAEGATGVVDACFAQTRDPRRCSTGAPDSALGAFAAADWGSEPGQVSIRGTADGYTLDSRSYSGAHFVIEQPRAGAARRTCRGSESECDSGTW